MSGIRKEMKRCDNCGKEFEGSESQDYCFPCDVALRAVEPPQVLKDYRDVYNGFNDGSPGQEILRRLYQQNAKEFLAQLRAAERDYRLGLKEEKSVEKSESAATEADEGSDSAKDLLKRWLEEREVG